MEKSVKIASASGALLPTPVSLRRLGTLSSDPRVVTPAYCYNFVEFVSNTKCVLYSTKMKQ